MKKYQILIIDEQISIDKKVGLVDQEGFPFERRIVADLQELEEINLLIQRLIDKLNPKEFKGSILNESD